METKDSLQFLHWGRTGKPLTWQWNNCADSRANLVILYFTVRWREKVKPVKATFKCVSSACQHLLENDTEEGNLCFVLLGMSSFLAWF